MAEWYAKGDKGDKGDQGNPGEPGSPGSAGPPNSLSIGTVSQGAAAVTLTGAAPAQVVNFVVPQGNPGAKGDKGDKGDPGEVTTAQLNSAVSAAIAQVVDGSPGALDTLNELAAALGDDPNFATTVTTALGNKADKVRKVQAGTGLTGGGDFTADRTLAVQYGNTAGTACQGNDTRLSDNRAPTNGSVVTASIGDSQVTSAKIADGTIVAGDLATAVQTSLGKANSATQPADLTAAQLVAINAQSGTTYTLDLSDQNKAVECANASAITVTVPPNTAKAFPIGSVIEVVQTGAGQVTIAQGSGVTVSSRSGLKLAGQWAVAVLRKRSTDGWILAGDTTT